MSIALTFHPLEEVRPPWRLIKIYMPSLHPSVPSSMAVHPWEWLHSKVLWLWVLLLPEQFKALSLGICVWTTGGPWKGKFLPPAPGPTEISSAGSQPWSPHSSCFVGDQYIQSGLRNCLLILNVSYFALWGILPQAVDSPFTCSLLQKASSFSCQEPCFLM